MSILEYLPIALAAAAFALRFVLSKPAAHAVQAWETSSGTMHLKAEDKAARAVAVETRAPVAA